MSNTSAGKGLAVMGGVLSVCGVVASIAAIPVSAPVLGWWLANGGLAAGFLGSVALVFGLDMQEGPSKSGNAAPYSVLRNSGKIKPPASGSLANPRR